MYIESVTSALIRASRALCLPAAVLYVGKCTVAALCQEESFPSRNLDSPSAKAKGACFIGLCLQVGPCSGHQIPCGDFRDTEGERTPRSGRFSSPLPPLTATKDLLIRVHPSGPGGVQTSGSCALGPLPLPSSERGGAGCLPPEPSPPGVSFFL